MTLLGPKHMSFTEALLAELVVLAEEALPLSSLDITLHTDRRDVIVDSTSCLSLT